MPETHAPPKSVSDPSDSLLIRTSKEAVKRSRELLEETKAAAEQERHWPAVRGPSKKPLQAD